MKNSIGLIVRSFEDLCSLEKRCGKTDSNGFCLARVKNQCENKLELKNAAFYVVFRDVEIST